MIQKFLEKRKMRQTLKRVIAPGNVESLLRGNIERLPLKQARIEFVLIFIRDDKPAQISELIEKVVALATAHGAVVHDFVGALVIVTFGTNPASSLKSGERASLVNALIGQLASNIKIVHGAAEGHYGLIGSENSRLSYTFLVPKFDMILGTLSRLAYGETEEFEA
jgi:hypothetical protein